MGLGIGIFSLLESEPIKCVELFLDYSLLLHL